MHRFSRWIYLLPLTLVLAACGKTLQASPRTPVVIIQTAPPLPTATIQPTEPLIVVPTATIVPTALPQVRVARAVNLRAGPSTEFAIIRTLEADTLVELQARRDAHGERWYAVRAGDDRGWVSAAIVQIEAAQAAALPVSSEP
jgi:hypothetical protein